MSDSTSTESVATDSSSTDSASAESSSSAAESSAGSSAASDSARAGRSAAGRTVTDPATDSATAGVSRWVGIAAIVAVVVAAAAAVFFGIRGYQAYFVDAPTQTARDAAVDGAERAILNVTTVNPKDTGEWKRRIDASLTGKALTQITQQDVNNLNSMLSQAGPQAATLTSRLVRSAPIEVDASEGNAKVLVYVAATSKREGESGVTQTMGFSVAMNRVNDDQWKASDIVPLNAVSYADSGSGDGAAGAGGAGGSTEQAPAPAQDAPAEGGGN